MPVLSLNSIRHTRPRGPHAAHTRPVLTAPPPGLPSVFHRGVEKWYLVRLITWRSRVRLPPPQPRGPLPKAAALAISRVVASRKAGAGVDPRPGGEIGDASAAKRRRKRGHMTPLFQRRRGRAAGPEESAAIPRAARSRASRVVARRARRPTARVRLPPPQPRGPLPKAAALAISRVVASREAGAGVDPRPGGEIGDASAAKRRRKRGHMALLHERRRGSAVGNELGAPRRILPNLRATRPYSPRSKAPPEGGAQEPTVRSSRKNQSSKALQGVRYAGLAVRVIAGPCVCEMQGGKRR